MRKTLSVTVIFGVVLSLFFMIPSVFAGKKTKDQNSQAQLTLQEESDLIQLREEEKLARDTYVYLQDLWGHRIFANISRSEQRHMNAVKKLLDKYNIPDPIENNEYGVFADSELQKLYNELTSMGSISLIDAFQVGGTIEDLDIYDIREMLKNTRKAALKRVYKNLMRGSENHLRAFVRQLEARGESYIAQYLTQNEIDEIINNE